MMPLPDYSAWLTPTRLAVEERLWNDPQHRTWTHFVAHIVRMSKGIQPIGSIVEFGCGIGLVPMNLPAKVRYVGIDANWHCIASAKARNPDRKMFFSHGDIRKIGIVSTDFDLTCAFSVMKHFTETEWPEILRKLLSYGKRGLFSMRIGETVVDDGTEFPHLQVTPQFCSQAIVDAGHQIVLVDPLPWGEVMVETCRI